MMLKQLICLIEGKDSLKMDLSSTYDKIQGVSDETRQKLISEEPARFTPQHVKDDVHGILERILAKNSNL